MNGLGGVVMSTAFAGHQTAFEQDVAAYLTALPELLGRHEGESALVAQGQLVGVHPNHADAMRAGYASFGLGGFLVQEVPAHDLEMGHHWLQSCQS